MISIAIDGPAGAGKSSIARAAAERLNYIYVDTGALYRTIGLAAARSNTNIQNEAEVEKLLKSLDINIVFFNGEQHVLLGDEDVSEKIRTEQASMMASKVSAIPAVRAYLLDTQRDFAKQIMYLWTAEILAQLFCLMQASRFFLQPHQKFVQNAELSSLKKKE